MSEFQFDFVTQYDQEAQKAQAAAQKMRELAACLSLDVPAPVRAVPFGYCADLGVTFDCKGKSLEDLQPLVARLLEAYPPMPLVDLPQARTQKPREFLRDTELTSAQREIYPVVFQYEALRDTRGLKSQVPPGRARWWTRLAAGVVEVSAEGAGADAFCIPMHAYVPDSHTYATGSQSMYHRKLLEYPLGEPAGFESGLSALNEFQASLPSPGARAVVNAVKDRIFRSSLPVVNLSMLQEKPGAYQHVFSRISPSRYLSEEQMSQLVDLAEKAESSLKASLKQARPLAQANLDKAADLVSELLSEFSGISDEVLVPKVLQQQISQKVGQGVSLAWVRFDKLAKSFDVRLQVSFGREASPAFKDLRIPGKKDAPGLTSAALNPVYVPVP